MSFWTDERVDDLRRLWDEGHSASKIAEKMGIPGGRNTIMGKAFRIGLKRKGLPNDLKAAPPAPVQAPPAEPKPEPKAPRRTYNPDSEPAVMKLRTTSCRFPMGDPLSASFRFCCKEADSNGPYCAEHARIAFIPMERRKSLPRSIAA